MDLFQFHESPEKLSVTLEQAHQCVPALFWHDFKRVTYRSGVNKLWMRLPALKLDPRIAASAAALRTRVTGELRSPELEESIAQCPRAAVVYALHIQCRFHDGEAAIARFASTAVTYARHIVQGRWEPGETVIAPHPEWALYYAKFILRDKFPAGEPAIASDLDSALAYATFTGERFLLAEPMLRAKVSAARDAGSLSLRHFGQDSYFGRWPEALE